MATTETALQIGSEPQESQLSSEEIAQAILYNQAKGHEDRVPHLVRLDLDEEKYPAQDVNTRFINGKRIPSSEMHDFVTEADSRFPELPKKLVEVEQETGLLSAIGAHMKAGGNVIVMCEHEQVTDLGYLSVAYSEVLEQMGYKFRVSIIAGKMIPYLGYDMDGSVTPLTDIMNMGGDRVYLSYPPETKSTLNSGIPAREVRKNNLGMGRQLSTDMDEGGWLIAMDPLGTTLKIKDGKAVFETEGVSSGTLGILKHAKTSIVLNGLIMSGEDIAFATDAILHKINNAPDLQDALDLEANLLNKLGVGVEFISPPLPPKLFESKIGKTALGAT